MRRDRGRNRHRLARRFRFSRIELGRDRGLDGLGAGLLGFGDGGLVIVGLNGGRLGGADPDLRRALGDRIRGLHDLVIGVGVVLRLRGGLGRRLVGRVAGLLRGRNGLLRGGNGLLRGGLEGVARVLRGHHLDIVDVVRRNGLENVVLRLLRRRVRDLLGIVGQGIHVRVRRGVRVVVGGGLVVLDDLGFVHLGVVVRRSVMRLEDDVGGRLLFFGTVGAHVVVGGGDVRQERELLGVGEVHDPHDLEGAGLGVDDRHLVFDDVVIDIVVIGHGQVDVDLCSPRMLMLVVSRFPLSSRTPFSAPSSGVSSVRSGVTAVSKEKGGANSAPFQATARGG